MKIPANGIQISIDFDKSKRTINSIPIFLLHGFTGKGSDWNFLNNKLPEKYFLIKIDIIGHGQSDSPSKSSFYSEKYLLKQLHTIVKYFGFGKNIFVGYSMGGRIALSYSVAYPNFVSAMVLESASPGIVSEAERALRLTNDKKLADSILQDGIEIFINKWMNQPFFSSLKNIGDEKLRKIIRQRSKSSPVGLSKILKEFSQGKMKSKWDLLKTFKFPVLLVSGELDKKYSITNKKVSELIKDANFKNIQNCGHNVHLEKEEEFTNLVNSFLNKYF